MVSETATMMTVQKLPGLCLLNHYFEVPLDYTKPSGPKIEIFAREVRSTENAGNDKLPFLIYLQGGPGFQSPRPESADGWLKRALKDFRVLLLDQRGTGLSSPVTHQSMPAIGGVDEQVAYLKHFRADNIVRDCEHIRKSLIGKEKWTVLGQSYGGFCITTYLSMHAEGLSGAVITGGFAPLVDNPDPVYRATYARLVEKNEQYYKRFPGDEELVAQIVKHLRSNTVDLPGGEILTVDRFLQLGLNFGFKCAGRGMNAIHFLLESAFIPNSKTETLSYAFLQGVENFMDFNTNPIYALLHESIYCQNQVSNWSAERIKSEFSEFEHSSNPHFFTGEMVYPWMFDNFKCLKQFKEVAEKLAQTSDWAPLYDAAVLKKNSVPCVGTIYYDDLYVDRFLAEETARTINGAKYWLTNEYEHDGLRQDGEKVLSKLLSMMKGEE